MTCENKETVIDCTVSQMLNSSMANEVKQGGTSLTRSWDNFTLAMTSMQVVNLGSPSIMTAQGVGMLPEPRQLNPAQPVNPA